MRIRPATAADTARLDEICLRTGDDGADATALYRHPDLVSAVYVRPYLTFAPDLAFVLADADDAAAGYVLGVADTAAFEEACGRDWWPPLRARYAIGTADPGSPDGGLLELIHHPERTPATVTDRFPAHLHVDLLPEAQGRGHGRMLVEHLFAELRVRHVSGVHLGVSPRNLRAVAFYRRLGFQPFDSADGGGLLTLHLT